MPEDPQILLRRFKQPTEHRKVRLRQLRILPRQCIPVWFALPCQKLAAIRKLFETFRIETRK
jgi:hypothetical protein